MHLSNFNCKLRKSVKTYCSLSIGSIVGSHWLRNVECESHGFVSSGFENEKRRL